MTGSSRLYRVNRGRDRHEHDGVVGPPRCYAAKRVDIRRAGRPLATPLFGCRVLRGPGELTRIVGRGCLGIARNTEIREAPETIEEENVGWLDVAVHDAALHRR